MSRFNEIVKDLENDSMYKDRNDPIAREALLMHAQCLLDDENHDPLLNECEDQFRQAEADGYF